MSKKEIYFSANFMMLLSWLFIGFSYWLSELVDVDWFTRSGAVMCLIAAIVNFGIVSLHQRELAKVLRDEQVSRHDKLDFILKPSKKYIRVSYLSYVSGILGTAIWGYGDLLL